METEKIQVLDGRTMHDYRHEWKHEINAQDEAILLQRLPKIMKLDPHAKDGTYFIRSLYFDTPYDTALKEKVNGVAIREKYRIRYYNDNTSYIVLEKKAKHNNMCLKESQTITKEQVEKLIAGDFDWLKTSGIPLFVQLYFRMKTTGLRPKTIVDYTRYPFVYGPGNVRVTIDTKIRTGLASTDFFNPNLATITAGDPVRILEVKWDAFLPDIIKMAVGLDSRHAAAFSKYMACRTYG